MVLLPDACVIDLYGTPTLLMHGDTLCIDDAPYQAFRTLCRSAEWQRQFMSRPITEREAFAKQARQESQRYTTTASNAEHHGRQPAVPSSTPCAQPGFVA
jgi:UDP-2,3-diacylglucosamine hydrolase